MYKQIFTTRASSGKHMICDFKGVSNMDLLNNHANLKNMLKEICRLNDFQILEEVEYSFTPEGYTILFLLTESHMSIHTFPEKSHISFDIYTCRQYQNNNEYIRIYEYLMKQLQCSETSTLNIIDRFF
jgi:S-adenosylmethionine decarboxylase proenzyme